MDGYIGIDLCDSGEADAITMLYDDLPLGTKQKLVFHGYVSQNTTNNPSTVLIRFSEKHVSELEPKGPSLYDG